MCNWHLLVYAKNNKTSTKGRLKLETKLTYSPMETKNIGAKTFVIN